MAEQTTLLQDAGAMIAKLPPADAAELTQRAALEGCQVLCRRLFGDRSLADVVATLFPEYTPPEVAEVAKRITLNAVRNACWKSVMETPGRSEATILAPDREAIAALRAPSGPAILPFWHFGPVNMLTIAFRHIGVPVLAIARTMATAWTDAPDLLKMRINVLNASPPEMVTAVRRCLEHLKRGGRVAVAVDGSLRKDDIRVPFLGRQFAVGRGAAALARLSGAPIIPCTMHWERTGWAMAIRIFEPLALPSVPPDDAEKYEHAILAALARRFEAHGRRYPGQFKIDQLAEVINSPSHVGH